ncbi:MAG: MerR family transcriptional regulator [Polyangiaceae bacterium]
MTALLLAAGLSALDAQAEPGAWTPSPPSCDAEPEAMSDAETDQPEEEFTIDELAARSKVPSRTIRFYQSKKALPSPKLRGRVAYYDQRHLERLELIANLQDRGLRINAIRDLLASMERGDVSVTEWLGLSDELRSPWADDQPRMLTEDELLDFAKSVDGKPRPGLIADLERLHLLERQGDRFVVRSPSLLTISLKLEAAGVDLETAAGAADILRKHLSKAAGELARFFFDHAGSGFGRDGSAEELSAALGALRPLGVEAVKVIFSKEIERELRTLAESGRAAKIPARNRRRKR